MPHWSTCCRLSTVVATCILISRVPSKKHFPVDSSHHHQRHISSIITHHPNSNLSSRPITMPPKQRIVVQRAEPSSYQSKGMLRSTYDTVTSTENAPVVRSILAFGVRRPTASTPN